MGASVVPVIDSGRAYASAAQPVNLELVTLTETGAILTWYTGEPGTDDGLGRMKPAPSDGEIVYGTHPRRLNRTVPGTAGTPYHYVELTGLEPGRTYFTRDLHGLHIVGLDTYDKPGGGGDAGGLSNEQMAWFQADLRAHKDQPTLVFGHHPLLSLDDPFAASGGTSLAIGQALPIMAAYEQAPGVFLHHAGHTHRNKRTILPGLPGSRHVTQQEVGAAKEYPGGFTLLRVHAGGYALNFYKTRGDLAREWSERTRQELNGLWPQLSFGPAVSDRNSVVARDLSGISSPA